MKEVDLFIFDLDGTLISSGADIVASVNYTLGEMGAEQLPYEEVVEFIGDGVTKLIARAIGKESGPDFERAMDIFSRHYAEHMLDTTRLYPGAMDVLNHFADKMKVIITNKREEPAMRILKELGIRSYFVMVIGADTTPYLKPDVRILRPLWDRYDVPRARTVVVGDGPNDILLAKNAGLISCALLNGLTRRELLLALHPDEVCEKIQELKELFC